MALAQIVHINPEVSYALWRIEEPLEALSAQYEFSPEDHAILASHKIPSRRMEWLSARLALKILMKERGIEERSIFKDEFGKPRVPGANTYISISHTKGWGAAVLSEDEPVGIDIEFPKPQVQRIARKFLHTEEYTWANDDMQRLTQVWCAKEALYKLHGRTQLTFANQLLIKAPLSGYATQGSIITDGVRKDFQLHYAQQENIIVCVAY